MSLGSPQRLAPQYQDLTRVSDSFRLPMAPAGYWLLVQFEMVLQTEEDRALVLVHPSYSPRSQERFSVGILCPPFFALAASSGELYLDNVGDVRALFAEIEAQVDLERMTRTFLYGLGLTNYRLQPNDSILEFKESNREPGKFKCYKVLRNVICNVSARDLVNLADPMCLSKLIYLPLPADDPLSMTVIEPMDGTGVSRIFRGARLTSNLCRILEQDFDSFVEHPITVPSHIMSCPFEGLILRVDLGGSARLTEVLTKKTHIYLINPLTIEELHELEIHRVFLSALARAGIMHYRFDGDGFVAGLPVERENQLQALMSVAELIHAISQFVDRVNRGQGDTSLSYRCALSWGSYRYGRFSLLGDNCYLHGADLIRIARLEEGLKSVSPIGSLVPRLMMDTSSYEILQNEVNALFEIVASDVYIQVKELAVSTVLLKERQHA